MQTRSLDLSPSVATASADLKGPCVQLELSRNKCRDKRIDVWPRAVDTTVFNPAFRSQAMRERMTDGHPDATILVYVGRLGAGTLTSPPFLTCQDRLDQQVVVMRCDKHGFTTGNGL